MELGALIKERRQSMGLTLRGTAKAIGCDAAYLSRIEADRTPPSEEMLSGLATALELDEAELSLLAGRLPSSFKEAAHEQPHELAEALKSSLRARAHYMQQRQSLPIADDGQRSIDDGFPFEVISGIAEAESWRKEVYRPVYHMHKWWAQRLGSIFRATILGAALPAGSDLMKQFYSPGSLDDLVVFDPFMGSGTTVGEAHKLGCTAIGRDINPVAHRAVSVALGPLNRKDLARSFDVLAREVAPKIQRLYKSTDSLGRPCDVLYYFWVKVLECPECGEEVDLFPRYVFTRHADRTKDVPVHVVCPDCGDVFPIGRKDTTAKCPGCASEFDPHAGPAKRTTAVCRKCHHEFKIAATARAAGHPPDHRLYAKLVLRENGAKEYLRATDEDLALLQNAKAQLARSSLPFPEVPIEDGRNTRQILNYGYRFWHQLFNERQLLALTTLAEGIARLPKGPSRDALALLFSGVLEFNNLFASYKGEGTGAVRHMFSHHILKPERMPIEANLWGTPQSSGAFSTLYRSRLLRAVEYRERPFEVGLDECAGQRTKTEKRYNLSPPMGRELHQDFPADGLPPGAIYLSCGSSAHTDIPDGYVDLVITDPPFFDNVHYSELADFFHVWQELYFGKGKRRTSTTRHSDEVQDVDAAAFSEKLRAVFKECNRVLRNGGRLVFSYHHSREDGWSSISRAVLDSGFTMTQAHPVKSEMSVAAPKSQAKEPIDLDIMIVCQKRTDDQRQLIPDAQAFHLAETHTREKVARFNRTRRRLSRNDVRVILFSQLLVAISPGRESSAVETVLNAWWEQAKGTIETIWRAQEIFESDSDEEADAELTSQLRLF